MQDSPGLAPGRAGPLTRADVVGATVSGQPAADGAHGSDGDVESGTIGQRAEPPCGQVFLVENNSAARLRVPPLRHTPPRPDLPFPAITTLRTRAPSPPMRKPRCAAAAGPRGALPPRNRLGRRRVPGVQPVHRLPPAGRPVARDRRGPADAGRTRGAAHRGGPGAGGAGPGGPRPAGAHRARGRLH